MLRLLWLISLWPASARCHIFGFVNGDGFIAMLGDSAKQSPLATTSLPQPPSIVSGETMFFVSRQTNATRLEATVAAGIVASAELTYSLTDFSSSGSSSSGSSSLINSVDPSSFGSLGVRQAVLLDNRVLLTAHIVTRSLGAAGGVDDGGQPSIDVVLHADGQPTTGGRCFRVSALRNGKERVTASCFLAPVETNRSSSSSSGGDSTSSAVATACLARLALPLDWTIGGGTIDVKFAQATSGTETCFRPTNSVKPAAEEDVPIGAWYSAGRVQLVAEGAGAGGLGYRDVQEDQHILLGVPDAVMRPGSTFTVPVKLQAESDLQTFSTKIRTSKDLRLLDARTADTSTWKIEFEPEERGGSVEAVVRSSETYTKMPKVQDVFYCQFEVLQAVQSGPDARITWTVEYESSYADINFVSHERKVITTRLKIGSDQIKHIVIAVKNNEIINLRSLRAQALAAPMWVYSVSYTGALRAVNAADGVQCSSRNPKILQVTKTCDGLFVPPGPVNCGTANVDVHFAQMSRLISFRVWCPDERLVVKLSDDKLNEVREWRTPGPSNASSRHDQVTPDTMPCRPRYQTAVVRVFARFYSFDREGQVIYYRGGGRTLVHSDITSMVQPFIRVADDSIATYKNGLVFGLSKGRTEVQVVLGNRLVAAKDLQVLRAKESLERFAVSVVSGASLSVSRRSDLPGILVASLNLKEKLDSKHQEAILDIWLKFTDGTYAAMSQFDPSEYNIVVESQNPGVVEVAPALAPYQPRLRAVSTGRAMVKVALFGSPECQQQGVTSPAAGIAARPLAVQFVYVAVDLGSGEEPESGHHSSEADYEHEMSNDLGSRRPLAAGGSKKNKEPAYQNDAALPLDNEAFMAPRHPSGGRASGGSGVQQAFVPAAAGAAAVGALTGQLVTPLDVGMYVVAGVLGVIVAVLAANCIVYARRHKRGLVVRAGQDIIAALPVGGAAPVKPSSGWVWIGRGTLEKHAVSTSCGEFMPEPDFTRRYSQCPLPGGSSGQTLLTASSSRTCSVRRSSSCGGATGSGSMYRGSECSVRITPRSGGDGDCCTGDRGSRGGRSSDGAATATTLSDEAFVAEGDEMVVDDDKPVITPDDADGDSFGCEPLLAPRRPVVASAMRPCGSGGVGGSSLTASVYRRPPPRSVCNGAEHRDGFLVNRQGGGEIYADDAAIDSIVHHSVSPIVADVGLTQDEFDNLKESVA